MGLVDLIGRVGSKNMITPTSTNDGFNTPVSFRSQSGITVNNDSALRITTFFFCLRLISGMIGSLPLQLKQPSKNGGYEKAEKHELYNTLRKSPDGNITSMLFWETGVTNMMTSGDLVAFKYLDNAGRTRLTLIPPQNVKIRWDTNKKMVVYDVTGNDGTVATYTRGDHRNGGLKIFHVPGFGFDGIKGKNIIQNFKETFGLNLAAYKYGNDWFAQGVTAGSLWTMESEGDINSEVLDDYKKILKELSTGTNNNGVPLVVPAGVKMEKTNALSPADLCWMDILRMTVADIANIFNVPRSLVMDVSSGTYSNLESSMRNLVDLCLMPYIVRIQEQIWLDLLSEKDQAKGIKAEFNITALVRADYATLVEGLRKLHNEGIYSANEVREYLGDVPQKGNAGNTYLANGNLRSVEQLALAPISNQPLPTNGGDNNNGAASI